MMRSLYTAASGMQAQQRNIDTVANNLANVNTTGSRRARSIFKICSIKMRNQRGCPLRSRLRFRWGCTSATV